MIEQVAKPDRVSRRRGRSAPTETKPLGNPAYRRLSNPFEPLRILSDDQVATLHETAIGLLEESGMRILHAEARAIFAEAGAAVDAASLVVKLDRALVAKALKTAPRHMRLRGGSAEREVSVGGRDLAIAPVGGPPHVSDVETGRRPGTLADYEDFTRLSQAFDVIHLLEPSVEPMDVPLPFRHLEMTRTQLTLSDKVPFVYSRGAPQVADCFAMFRIARGLSEEDFAASA